MDSARVIFMIIILQNVLDCQGISIKDQILQLLLQRSRREQESPEDLQIYVRGQASSEEFQEPFLNKATSQPTSQEGDEDFSRPVEDIMDDPPDYVAYDKPVARVIKDYYKIEQANKNKKAIIEAKLAKERELPDFPDPNYPQEDGGGPVEDPSMINMLDHAKPKRTHMEADCLFGRRGCLKRNRRYSRKRNFEVESDVELVPKASPLTFGHKIKVQPVDIFDQPSKLGDKVHLIEVGHDYKITSKSVTPFKLIELNENLEPNVEGQLVDITNNQSAHDLKRIENELFGEEFQLKPIISKKDNVTLNFLEEIFRNNHLSKTNQKLQMPVKVVESYEETTVKEDIILNKMQYLNKQLFETNRPKALQHKKENYELKRKPQPLIQIQNALYPNWSRNTSNEPTAAVTQQTLKYVTEGILPIEFSQQTEVPFTASQFFDKEPQPVPGHFQKDVEPLSSLLKPLVPEGTKINKAEQINHQLALLSPQTLQNSQGTEFTAPPQTQLNYQFQSIEKGSPIISNLPQNNIEPISSLIEETTVNESDQLMAITEANIIQSFDKENQPNPGFIPKDTEPISSLSQPLNAGDTSIYEPQQTLQNSVVTEANFPIESFQKDNQRIPGMPQKDTEPLSSLLQPIATDETSMQQSQQPIQNSESVVDPMTNSQSESQFQNVVTVANFPNQSFGKNEQNIAGFANISNPFLTGDTLVYKSQHTKDQPQQTDLMNSNVDVTTVLYETYYYDEHVEAITKKSSDKIDIMTLSSQQPYIEQNTVLTYLYQPTQNKLSQENLPESKTFTNDAQGSSTNVSYMPQTLENAKDIESTTILPEVFIDQKVVHLPKFPYDPSSNYETSVIEDNRPNESVPVAETENQLEYTTFFPKAMLDNEDSFTREAFDRENQVKLVSRQAQNQIVNEAPSPERENILMDDLNKNKMEMVQNPLQNEQVEETYQQQNFEEKKDVVAFEKNIDYTDQTFMSKVWPEPHFQQQQSAINEVQRQANLTALQGFPEDIANIPQKTSETNDNSEYMSKRQFHNDNEVAVPQAADGQFVPPTSYQPSLNENSMTAYSDYNKPQQQFHNDNEMIAPETVISEATPSISNQPMIDGYSKIAYSEYEKPQKQLYNDDKMIAPQSMVSQFLPSTSNQLIPNGNSMTVYSEYNKPQQLRNDNQMIVPETVVSEVPPSTNNQPNLNGNSMTAYSEYNKPEQLRNDNEMIAPETAVSEIQPSTNNQPIPNGNSMTTYSEYLKPQQQFYNKNTMIAPETVVSEVPPSTNNQPIPNGNSKTAYSEYNKPQQLRNDNEMVAPETAVSEIQPSTSNQPIPNGNSMTAYSDYNKPQQIHNEMIAQETVISEVPPSISNQPIPNGNSMTTYSEYNKPQQLRNDNEMVAHNEMVAPETVVSEVPPSISNEPIPNGNSMTAYSEYNKPQQLHNDNEMVAHNEMVAPETAVSEIQPSTNNQPIPNGNSMTAYSDNNKPQQQLHNDNDVIPPETVVSEIPPSISNQPISNEPQENLYNNNEAIAPQAVVSQFAPLPNRQPSFNENSNTAYSVHNNSNSKQQFFNDNKMIAQQTVVSPFASPPSRQQSFNGNSNIVYSGYNKPQQQFRNDIDVPAPQTVVSQYAPPPSDQPSFNGNSNID
ncbi:uncharacterized protein LOC126910610 isoform X1 [Spodoptera frugiperda]|uniref:Uncharacterized protein LOC126910610 isoform X1 n=1 Tax=Spodoptera frugiperda TaxID=7108 RepID=A0A9R0DTT5_SPOFR|nr:uncharacterized protein LOC126910610 isoform X1 [Spodoptera frugiperda]